jgi:DNA-binding LacI/PurR family transcriptional regulator
MKKKALKRERTPGSTRLADIARLAGVSVMTVSRALRGGTYCSQATRETVEKAARKLHYRSNPLVSIYQAHVRRRRSPDYQATLAWFSDWPQQGHFETTLWDVGLWNGATRRAAQLGYRLEEYWTGRQIDHSPERSAETARRCARILHSRGIPGMIIPTLFNEEFGWCDWPELAISSIGEHMPGAFVLHKTSPEIRPEIYHVVFTDWFANMRLAYDRLRQLGFRRIGLMLGSWHNEHSQRRYSGAFLDQSSLRPPRERVPVFCTDTEGVSLPPGLDTWLRRHKPDAVICSENTAKGWIEACGFSVPRDLGLAYLSLASDVADWSGIDPGLEAQGAAAVDVLVNQLHNNERGRPASPVCTSFRGHWKDGTTVLVDRR